MNGDGVLFLDLDNPSYLPVQPTPTVDISSLTAPQRGLELQRLLTELGPGTFWVRVSSTYDRGEALRARVGG